jgi:hypothetical protein
MVSPCFTGPFTQLKNFAKSFPVRGEKGIIRGLAKGKKGNHTHFPSSAKKRASAGIAEAHLYR